MKFTTSMGSRITVQKGAIGLVGRRTTRSCSVPIQVLTVDQILTNAIHDIDRLQYWLGDIIEIFAMEGPKERQHPIDPTVQLIFRFSSSVVGSFLFTE